MKLLYRILLLTASSAALFLSVPAYAQENVFHLKPGAHGKICLGCHVDIQEKLSKPFVHTPVKIGQCTGCHDPHTSNHPKQLAADTSKICFKCHKDIVPSNARSVHKVAREGKCVNCHDPHASDNKFNLLKSGNDLCFGCHKDMAQKVASVRFKHDPVEKGCINCHSPHASPGAEHLLKNDVPDLCKGCHNINAPIFASKHMGYPVGNAKCILCHNPHGSNRAGMLFDNVHPPVESKMCGQCHESTTSQNPLALKKPVFELCRSCHSNMVDDALGKNQLHWPFYTKGGCLICHTPHASKETNLLNAPMLKLCGKCHSDTIERQEKSVTKHEPIKDGKCMACHAPHASDNLMLFNQTSVINLCGSCHEWQKHSTHPIGPKYTDPRNKNNTLMCLSCHRAHGTPYKTMIPFPTITELCIQCHKEYKR